MKCFGPAYQSADNTGFCGKIPNRRSWSQNVLFLSDISEAGGEMEDLLLEIVKIREGKQMNCVTLLNLWTETPPGIHQLKDYKEMDVIPNRCNQGQHAKQANDLLQLWEADIGEKYCRNKASSSNKTPF